MSPSQPPAFLDIASKDVKGAFIKGYPEVTRWLEPGTKLFKWTQSITTPAGISAWWQFVQPLRLATGSMVPGIQEMQTHAGNLNAPDRDFSRTRLAVTEEWNKMTNAIAISLVEGAWGHIGKAASQRKNRDDPSVYLIGGEYQVWIPGLLPQQITRMRLGPYLKPNTPFSAR